VSASAPPAAGAAHYSVATTTGRQFGTEAGGIIAAIGVDPAAVWRHQIGRDRDVLNVSRRNAQARTSQTGIHCHMEHSCVLPERVLAAFVYTKRSTSMVQKQQQGFEKQQAEPMQEPLKKHGDKVGLGKFGSGKKRKASHGTGGAGEPLTTPLEPEEQGGVGGP